MPCAVDVGLRVVRVKVQVREGKGLTHSCLFPCKSLVEEVSVRAGKAGRMAYSLFSLNLNLVRPCLFSFGSGRKVLSLQTLVFSESFLNSNLDLDLSGHPLSTVHAARWPLSRPAHQNNSQSRQSNCCPLPLPQSFSKYKSTTQCNQHDRSGTIDGKCHRSRNRSKTPDQEI